jgi:hypothetical protein
MKKTFLLAISALSLLNSCGDKSTETGVASKDTTAVAVQEEKKDDARPMPDSATMARNWEQYMSPGDVHKMMASWDGDWTANAIMWPSPDAPADTSKLTVSHKMILGGRYQVAAHKGNMMGMPFEGISTTGYDNAKKKFINTWIDNTGTGVMYMEGTWDEGTKAITYTGKMVSIERNDGSEEGVKQVLRITDPTHQQMEMFMIDASGKETKTMEIWYTKK